MKSRCPHPHPGIDPPDVQWIMLKPLLAVLGSALLLSACAPATTTRHSPVAAPAGQCRPGTTPVTGISVQSVFDGDYGSLLSQRLLTQLNEAGFKAHLSSDYPDVNRASIDITGLIDRWANPQDQSIPRVGIADLQVADRATGTALNRFQMSQGAAFTSPTLPEYVDMLVWELQRRYCQV